MCGRFRSSLPRESTRELLRYLNEIADIRPRYNAAPTDMLPVVRLDRERRRELVMMRWGLVPFWAKDTKIGARFINARAETVATLPAFRDAFKARRCLVPADGFYEWRKGADGTKQPYHIGLREGAPFAFAGLWEHWTKGPASIESFTIVTGPPNSLVAEIHDRMPVILDPDDYEAWLTAPAADAQALLVQPPFPSQLMAAYAVSTRVNSVKNDDPSLVEPVEITRPA